MCWFFHPVHAQPSLLVVKYFVCLQMLSLDQLQGFYSTPRLNSVDVISVNKNWYHKITISSKYHGKTFASKHWVLAIQRYAAIL